MASHIHRYHKVDIGKRREYFVFACALPDCTHYLHSENQVVGKFSLCWRCGKKFIIAKDVRGRVLKRPHCVSCTRVMRGNKQPKVRIHPDDVRAPIFGESEPKEQKQEEKVTTLIDLLGNNETDFFEEDDE